MTTVVNINKEPYDAYCGRGSLFGTPYEVGVDGTRSEVIERFKKWFNFLLRDKVFKEEVIKLRGKKLEPREPTDEELDVMAKKLIIF